MTGPLTTLAISSAAAEALSLLMLHVGGRWVASPTFERLGRMLHRQKMRSLERVWPMTRLASALDERDEPTIRRITTALILIKSAACFLFGVVALFWLPLAALLVPAVVAAHDPTDPALRGWAVRVARWQVTSHVLAAAPGFALVLYGPLGGRTLAGLASQHVPALTVWLVGSALCAVAAGRLEARGLARHWGTR